MRPIKVIASDIEECKERIASIYALPPVEYMQPTAQMHLKGLQTHLKNLFDEHRSTLCEIRVAGAEVLCAKRPSIKELAQQAVSLTIEEVKQCPAL